jgi:hypothetical protein
MEIPNGSRKCPYCHHFQNRLVLFLYHPGFAALVVMLPFVVMMVVFASMMNRGQNFAVYASQMAVTNSRIVFGEKKSGPTVAVIGTIKNLSPVPWKDAYFHVDFFDSAGKLTDSGAVENYEYYLPANETASFKLSFAREFPETNYIRTVVRVVGAKDARAQW